VTYEEWMEEVPKAIKSDPLWQSEAYRKALFLHDLAWEDCARLMNDPRGRALIGQLTEAAGSISANLEEGFGRGFSKDRDYFLRVSIGSSRETRGWYYRSHHLIPSEVLEHRPNLASEVIALLVTELSKHRRV
jgi:four helix bundle protein